MELLIIFQTAIFAGAFIWLGLRTRTRVVEKPSVLPVSVSSPGHKLTKTWLEADPTDSAYPGWRWKCSCGVQGCATTCSKTSLGSEKNAIEQFKNHAQGYKEANFDSQQSELEQITEEYKEYRAKCFCKDTNDDLILLNRRHLDKTH